MEVLTRWITEQRPAVIRPHPRFAPLLYHNLIPVDNRMADMAQAAAQL